MLNQISIFCKVLYRVTTLCKFPYQITVLTVLFVFYFSTRSLFWKIVVQNHFFATCPCTFVVPKNFWCAYLWITAILILSFANNHSGSIFLQIEAIANGMSREPPQRQDCCQLSAKRVPSEAKPLWMEWKRDPFEEIKFHEKRKDTLVDYWTGELYFEHSGSLRLGPCESWWGPCEGKFQVELSGETWCFAGGAWCSGAWSSGAWCLVLGEVNWANVTIYPAPYKSR